MTQKIQISGYYINLNESEERRVSFQNNVQTVGLNDIVKRFSALRGDDRACGITKTELGCFLSHKAIIDQANDAEFVMVFEDDAFLPKDFKRIIYGVCNQNHDGSNWDLLFMGQCFHYGDISRMARLLELKKKLNPRSELHSSEFVFLDSSEWYIWGCHGYVIHPNSLGKIRRLLLDAKKNGFKSPIDTYYRQVIKQGEIASKVVFPYIVGVNANMTSTLTDRSNPFEHNLHHSTANLFTIGVDIPSMKDQALNALLGSDIDDEAFLASQIIYKKLSAR